jgi:antibiotic biosynthesis monooxygenase (ABM) superfamily enzyme
MIKVIVGYKVKSGADMQPVLIKLTAHAMTYPGFVGAETLRSEADSSLIVLLKTWDKVDDWRSWETSKLRQSVLDEAKAFLLEEPRVTLYRMMSPTGWA